MKNIKIVFGVRLPIALLGFSILLASCTKNYSEINRDRNSIATVGAAELPFLFSRAQASAVPGGGTYQVSQNLFADLYAQYFANTATYFPSDRLFMRLDWARFAFNPIYTSMMPQLQTIMEVAGPGTAEHALANIVWVVGFHRVTDYWGPIPYFKAGEPAKGVPYDPQDKIYDDFFIRLKAAVDVLKTKTSEKPFGAADLIYGGDVSRWIRYANAMRLRLALRISNVDPARAKAEAEAAVADGVMTTSPGDDALIKKSDAGNDWNGLSMMSDWNEFRMSASMESVLKGYSDPRMEIYFLPTSQGKYDGIRNGLTAAQLGETVNNNSNNSHVGARWSNPLIWPGGLATFLTTPQNVMSTAESYFLRAEGALLGWNMSGTAKQLYEEGIKNSFRQWGINAAAIEDYINGTSVPVAPEDFLNSPPMTDIPVRFNETDINVAREQIATQKWLAMFPDGREAWADYRRSRYLKLYPVANSDNADIPDPNTKWIRRIPFLIVERQNNGAEVEKAESLLNGPDKVTTPLWWDKN